MRLRDRGRDDDEESGEEAQGKKDEKRKSGADLASASSCYFSIPSRHLFLLEKRRKILLLKHSIKILWNARSSRNNAT